MANIKGITIEIGGDTSKLSTALNAADKEIRNTQNDLRKVEAALKFDPGNTDLMRDKQKLLGDEISQTKNKLDTLKEAQRQAAEQLARGDIGKDEYDALGREIDITKAKLGGFEDQMKEFGSVSSQKLEETSKKVKEVGDKVQSAGESMTKVVTGPIVAVAGASAAAWKEVDDAMDTVVTKTGETGDTLKSLQDSVSKVATSIPTSFENAGTAVGEINTRFGATGDALEGLSTQFIQFSEINGTDLNESIDSTSRILQQFGMDAKDTDGLLGLLSSTSQKTGADTASLMQDLENNGAAFRDMGLDAGSAINLLGNFETAGIDSGTAMSGMAKAAVNWQKEGKDVKTGLSELIGKLQDGTVTTKDYNAVVDVFGSKAADKFVDMAKSGRLSLENLGTDLSNYKTTVTDTYNGTLDPADKATIALNKLKQTGSDLFTSIQAAAEPLMDSINEKLTQLNTWWNSLSEGQQQMIIKIIAIVAAIGPAIIIIGEVIKLVSTLITIIRTVQTVMTLLNLTMAASPIGWIILLIAGLIAVGVLLYKNWDLIKEKAGELGTAIGQKWGEITAATSEACNNVKETMSNAMSSAHDYVRGKLDNIKQAYEEHGGGINGIVAAGFEAMKTKYAVAYDAINKLSGEKLGEALGTMKSHIEDMKTNVATGLQNIRNSFDNKLSDAYRITADIFGKIQNTINEKIENAKAIVFNGVQKLKEFFKFEWKLPDIKLPHFSINGNFSLRPPAVPSFGVNWYDTGGIFDSPALIGVGEKRTEIVGALDDFRAIVREESGAGNNAALLQQMQAMTQLMAQYLPQIATLKVILDSGKLVGSLTPAVDAALGARM